MGHILGTCDIRSSNNHCCGSCSYVCCSSDRRVVACHICSTDSGSSTCHICSTDRRVITCHICGTDWNHWHRHHPVSMCSTTQLFCFFNLISEEWLKYHHSHT